MKFTLTIEVGNDAMQTGSDLKRTLGKVGSVVGHYEVLRPFLTLPIYDENGNNVGKWEVTGD